MIRTIFSSESLVESYMQTCGFVSRAVKKELFSMRDLAFKLKIPYLTMNQFSLDYELDAFIFLPKGQNAKYMNCQINSKYDFLIIVNGKVIRKFDPQDIVEECYSFPLLEIQTTRYKKIELYFGDENMDILNKKFEGDPAFLVQTSIDTLKGLNVINPLRHKGTLKLKQGYERLFPYTQDYLGEFNHESKLFASNPEWETNENVKNLRFVSIETPFGLQMADFKPYAELKARLLADYRSIKQLTASQLRSSIDDPNLNQKNSYINLLNLLDISK